MEISVVRFSRTEFRVRYGYSNVPFESVAVRMDRCKYCMVWLGIVNEDAKST